MGKVKNVRAEDIVIDALWSNCFGALAIDAALFVPQSRERVFIVAVDATPISPPSWSLTGQRRRSIRRRWSPPASASALRSGGASQSRRSETRYSPTSSRTNQRASPGTHKPRPID